MKKNLSFPEIIILIVIFALGFSSAISMALGIKYDKSVDVIWRK